jgi:hypothetical protein
MAIYQVEWPKTNETISKPTTWSLEIVLTPFITSAMQFFNTTVLVETAYKYLTIGD